MLTLLVLLCRRYLYDMTSKWLTGGSNYKVDRVYVWNAGENGWSCWLSLGADFHQGGGGRSPTRGAEPRQRGRTPTGWPDTTQPRNPTAGGTRQSLTSEKCKHPYPGRCHVLVTAPRSCA